jgi:hypothetical protein
VFICAIISEKISKVNPYSRLIPLTIPAFKNGNIYCEHGNIYTSGSMGVDLTALEKSFTMCVSFHLKVAIPSAVDDRFSTTISPSTADF